MNVDLVYPWRSKSWLFECHRKAHSVLQAKESQLLIQARVFGEPKKRSLGAQEMRKSFSSRA